MSARYFIRARRACNEAAGQKVHYGFREMTEAEVKELLGRKWELYQQIGSAAIQRSSRE